MIQLKNLTLRRGNKILLNDISVIFNINDKIGITGLNGCGKSSLFALILNELQQDSGEIRKTNNLTTAHIAQEIPYGDKIAYDYAIDGDYELRQVEKELQNAEIKNDHQKIATLHDKLQAIDGYSAKARAIKILLGLGFTQDNIHWPINNFSGGWKMRLNLAQVLMSRADILLLDEPTNHLDLDAVIFLEKFLQKFSRMLLLISHDRTFLDNTVNRIAHFENKKITLYSGNYSSFVKEHAEKLNLQHKNFIKQQKAREHMMEFVNKFGAKATKAKQAQSRLKAIAKLPELIDASSQSPFSFNFFLPEKLPNPLITLEHTSVGYTDNIVLQNINFSLTKDMRIGLLGKNGAGKSTFIKFLAGKLEPIYGKKTLSSNIKIGYFAQQQLDALNLEETPFWHISTLDKAVTPQSIRDFLGGFAFNGDMANSKVANFSGGEKARLALAMIVWQKPNLLLLDEPTNHLDIEMREALILALQNYSGALITVSHDRYFLENCIDELYLVSNHSVDLFDGDISTYEDILLNKTKITNSTANDSTNISKQEKHKEAAENRQLNSAIKNAIKKIENELEKLQEESLQLETILSDEQIYLHENKNLLQETITKQQKIKKILIELEEKWLIENDKLS